MTKLTLKPKKSKTYKNVVRFGLIAAGISLTIIADYVTTGYTTLFLKITGMILVVFATVNPLSLFGAHNELLITDEFVRTTDEVSLTRTAYWNRINNIVLNRFSLRIIYESGIGEHFRLPYLNNKEFNNLRSILIKKSNNHDFNFQQKPWCKLF